MLPIHRSTWSTSASPRLFRDSRAPRLRRRLLPTPEALGAASGVGILISDYLYKGWFALEHGQGNGLQKLNKNGLSFCLPYMAVKETHRTLTVPRYKHTQGGLSP